MMKKYVFLSYLSHFRDEHFTLPPDSLLSGDHNISILSREGT